MDQPSSPPPMASTSTSLSTFRAVFDTALSDYTKQTGIDLAACPFAQALQDCHSASAILDLLQEKAKQFQAYREGNRKLINCLKPVVQVLHTVSAILAPTLVPFQPTGAILVGVDVLLTTAIGVNASYDALVDLFECIGSFLNRLRIYNEITFSPSMSEIAIKIMVQVLSVLSLATKQIKQGRLKKFAKKLLGESEIEAVLQRLDRLTLDEARMTGTETLQVVHGLLSNMKLVMDDGKTSMDDIRHALVAMQEMTSEINKMKRDQLQRDIRSWLSPPDPSKNHNLARGAHRCGTAEWFTQGSTFREWMTTGSFLWIHGKPGAGKSVLCSSIIQEIKLKCDRGLALMGYYYFDFKDIAKQGIHGLLTSLLAQLCAKSDPCYQILSRLYSENDAGSKQPDNGALTECLKEILRIPELPTMYIIMDALDECPNTSGFPTAREEVLQLLEELAGIRLSNLRICVTSRPEVDIRSVLEPFASLQVSLHDEFGQKQDILNYINSIVHSDRRMRKWRPEDMQLVVDTLSARADGMFRWVYCQLETLRRCFPTVIQRALEELPETLDETYERTLLGIEKEKREFAHRLFQCLTVAVRPLRVDELAEVLAIRFESGQLPRYHEDWRSEDGQEAVLSACSSLITVVNVDGSPVVQFSHFSVKEFLTSDRLSNSKSDLSCYHILPQSAHTILAQASLSVLLHLGDRVDKDNIQYFPFAQYAAQHWVDHGRFQNVSSNLQEAMERLFDLDEPSFATWIWIYDMDYPFRQHMFEAHPAHPEAVPLYYATLCGFPSLVKFLINTHPSHVNASGGFHGVAVNAALALGNTEIALLLLKHGADVNIMDEFLRTPLYRASESGRCDDAELLLEHHADVDLRDDRGDTPLLVAAREGYLDVVRVLLRHGATVDSRSNEGWTPLTSVSRYGHIDIVRLLIQSGAAVDSRDNIGWSPLTFAAKRGHLAIFELLIQSGAAVDSRTNNGRTALMIAASNGHLAVVRLLIQSVANLDSSDNIGQSALMCAAGGGHLAVMESLIQSGASVDCRDNEGYTALTYASNHGHSDVVRLLIQCGASIDSRHDDGWTPLMQASNFGYLDVLQLLLESGAAVDLRNNKGETPLMQASASGHLHVAQELLDHGVAVNAQNIGLSTPLHLASANGHLGIVALLIARHADVEKRDTNQQTPLNRATVYGHHEIASLLLKNGSSPNSQDSNDSTPLHLAASNGNLDMVKLLLQSGADVNVRNRSRQTALDLASASRNREVTKCLSEHMGVMDTGDAMDVILPDQDRQNMHLNAASSSLGEKKRSNPLGSDEKVSLHSGSALAEGNLDVLRSLLDRGADVNERNASRRTPLLRVSRAGKLEVAELLIKYGADVNCRDKYSLTPLLAASRKGFSGTAKLLLDHGADINAKQQDLRTPLHFAAWGGHLKIARLLVERGADIHNRDLDGRTPSGLASRAGAHEIVRLISDGDRGLKRKLDSETDPSKRAKTK